MKKFNSIAAKNSTKGKATSPASPGISVRDVWKQWKWVSISWGISCYQSQITNTKQPNFSSVWTWFRRPSSPFFSPNSMWVFFSLWGSETRFDRYKLQQHLSSQITRIYSCHNCSKHVQHSTSTWRHKKTN